MMRPLFQARAPGDTRTPPLQAKTNKTRPLDPPPTRLSWPIPAADRVNVRESLFAEVFNGLLQQNLPTTDSCTAAKLIVDRLDGLREQRERHGEAQRLGGLHVDHQLELGRQLNRKIGRLGAFEDLIDVAACTNKQIG